MSLPSPESRLMRTPRRVNIDLTARCNLRCRYCYFFDNPALVYRDLPTAEWLRFFDDLGRLGVMDVVLAGGEPFTRPDLPELLDGIVRNHMRYSLLSNGSCIDDRAASLLAATGRCNYVQVSLDGSCAAVHDTARGQGAFAGAVRGIRTLQRYNVPVAVRVTIHRQNLHDLEATARFLLDDLQIPAFTTNTAGYLGGCQQHARELLLDPAQRSQAMQTLLDLQQRYPGRISASAGPLAEARMWPEMIAASAQGAPAFSKGGRLTACGCPSSEITVRADGVIVPCSMLAHIALGHINQDAFQDVWLNSPALNRLRNRRQISLNDFAFCQDCAFTLYCTGNCPGLAYNLTGQVDAPSPDACLRRFLADGGQLPATAPSPALP